MTAEVVFATAAAAAEGGTTSTRPLRSLVEYLGLCFPRMWSFKVSLREYKYPQILHLNLTWKCKRFFLQVGKHTVRNLHFLSKNTTLISRENCRFFGVKNSWKCFGFGQLWFHEKNCQKNFGWKTRENVGFFVKIEFLDKNLTFRIVWRKR